MDRFTGGCLCDNVRWFFCPRCGSAVFSRTADEINVNLGSLDAPDQ